MENMILFSNEQTLDVQTNGIGETYAMHVLRSFEKLLHIELDLTRGQLDALILK